MIGAILLTTANVKSDTLTWDGGASNSTWAGNNWWNGTMKVGPTAADDLILAGAGTNQTNAPDPFNSGASFNAQSITFQDGFNLTNTTTVGDSTTSSALIHLSTGWSLNNNATSGTVAFQPSVNGATGVLKFNLTGTGTMSVNTGATTMISALIQNETSSVGGVTKTGNGTLTFSGANTYSGTTAVTNGTLFINGNQSAATGAVSVNGSGSTLGGTGTAGGPVTLTANGILQGGTGAATGALSIANGVNSSAGILQLALAGSGAHSTLSLTGGAWTFGATQTFNFLDLGATAGTYTGIITGLTSDPGSEGAWTSNLPGTFAYNAGSINFTFAPVPEPSTWAAGILTVAALGFSQRKRLRHLGLRFSNRGIQS
ncbi:MAG: autotransporter-associated beta strand repeat-containing protein [Chthoniobacterales bacterium]